MSGRVRVAALLASSALLAVGCSAPPAVQRIRERYPRADFEVRLDGCAAPGVSARRFGSDVEGAVVWSRERVKSARYFPCTALIRAVISPDTADVYRVSLTRNGRYEERALAPE